MRSERALAIVCALAVASCGNDGRSLELGAPERFKLAVYNQGTIGIDLELRVPQGYESSTMPYDWFWSRGNREPSITVTTDPTRRRATIAQPCGDPAAVPDEQLVIRDLRQLPDGLIVSCEQRYEGHTRLFWVIRFVRNIEDIVSCAVHFRMMESPGAAWRAAAMSTCESLRVLGRSNWKPADYLRREDAGAGTGAHRGSP